MSARRVELLRVSDEAMVSDNRGGYRNAFQARERFVMLAVPRELDADAVREQAGELVARIHGAELQHVRYGPDARPEPTEVKT